MYETKNPRKFEYKGFIFEAFYKNAISEKIDEEDVIPYSEEIIYMLDKENKPYRFFSKNKVNETLKNMFIRNGNTVLGVEPNQYKTSPIEELIERKYNETVELLYSWGYPTYLSTERELEIGIYQPKPQKQKENTLI